MGYVSRAREFFRRNPALDVLGGFIIVVGTVTPFWVFAAKKPEPGQAPATNSDVSR